MGQRWNGRINWKQTIGQQKTMLRGTKCTAKKKINRNEPFCSLPFGVARAGCWSIEKKITVTWEKAGPNMQQDLNDMCSNGCVEQRC